MLPTALSHAWPASMPSSLDPRGAIHIPIGIPNTLDTLKTFVEAEGCFSPGFGSYGIYFWLYDPDARKLWAPGMEGVSLRHGLASGLPIPWSEWDAGGLMVRTEVCEVVRPSAQGDVFVVGAKVHLRNSGGNRRVALYAAVRALGAAGADIHRLEVAHSGDALLVDGHCALLADRMPAAAGVAAEDTIGEAAAAGRIPPLRSAQSEGGDCSGALRFEWNLAAGSSAEVGFTCPVLPGRRAARHQWVDLKQNAMVDIAELNPKEGGTLQPDLGLEQYRRTRSAALFPQAHRYWAELLSRTDVLMPDPRWGESMRAILAHAALCMNEGAPDVAVVNYNVFNRDGMYMANMMQKAGLPAYSEQILDYFIRNPFNGRAYPEADNPGQILWAIYQHWMLTRDQAWLARIYPNVRKIVSMVRYYRTAPGPHWVDRKSLNFGEALPEGERQELRPGRCDGFHPEYTEAFDIAGLRGAADLASASGNRSDAADWAELAGELLNSYDSKFGTQLARQYGSYAVLWPCRLFPNTSGRAYEQFKNVGAQPAKSWRYFPLATAHQGLLTGNREAASGTLRIHLAHPQMQGWYALDEGGGSGSGGWHRVRTTWKHSKEAPGENRSVAMPHSWAMAEFWLLMRDSIAFEEGNRLILLSGVPAEWFKSGEGMRASGMATYFGNLGFTYKRVAGGAEFELTGPAAPPEGSVLRLPPELNAAVVWGASPGTFAPSGECIIPPGTRRIVLSFS
jgi:hypothetical protein